MFLPVKNMMQHIESLLLIKFEKNYCRNEIHTLTISKLWKRVSNRVKNRSHFASELLDKLILRKSSVKIEINLFALVFAFIKRVWFDGFQDELRPDLPSESVWYTWSDVVDHNSLIRLLEIFDIRNNMLFPSLKLATDFLVICEFDNNLMRKVISFEAILIVNRFWSLLRRLHKKEIIC